MHYKYSIRQLYTKKEFKNISTNPIIFTSNNFITYKNCDHLISISKNNLMKSLDFNGDKSKFRSGSIAFLNHDNDQVTKELIGK